MASVRYALEQKVLRDFNWTSLGLSPATIVPSDLFRDLLCSHPCPRVATRSGEQAYSAVCAIQQVANPRRQRATMAVAF